MLQIRDYNLGKYEVPPDAKDGICIDIGANVGDFSHKYANFFSKILYYEPIKECFDICQNKLKEYNHIVGHNLAVWSESNKIVNILFHDSHDSGSCAIESEILNHEWSKDNIVQEVKTISLKDILSSIDGDISYCKSDCENSEYFIFLNADLNRIKYISLELHAHMGKEKNLELLNYIDKTHSMVGRNFNYVSTMNKELLFQRRQ